MNINSEDPGFYQIEPALIKPAKVLTLISSEPGCIFIDVRSHIESYFVGSPQDTTCVPWMEEPNWEVNPNFVNDVLKLFEDKRKQGINVENIHFILICRSGNRSFTAGKALIHKGFLNVCSVEGGFEGDVGSNGQRNSINGWRAEGLFWQQC